MIDIIVPIYNGYEDTKRCVESLLKSVNKVEHRIILINDNSPSEEIVKYLKEVDDKKIIILTNEVNLGFVKTINKGIKYSENDVILLNSDTVVTDEWIDKMHEAAYSDNKIATVTPLTNSGSIASVPHFNKPGKLAEGFTVEEFGKLVNNVSRKVYPTIPTAVGFAMFIKRSVINEIGFLDEDSFGKGYCEEEDFSCRAIKKGYKNILADNVFVYHEGNVSFKEDKVRLLSENKKKLIKKHRWHPFNVKKFLYFDKTVPGICRSIQQEILHLDKLPMDVKKETVL